MPTQSRARHQRPPNCFLSLVAFWGVITLICSAIIAGPTLAQGRSATPYSRHHERLSRPIEGITWLWETRKAAATGSDNFPMTWAADDHQYTIGGDGYGFGNQKPKQSMIFSRVKGSFDDQGYEDLWSGDGKSYGLLTLGDRAYVWRGPGSGVQSFAETWLYVFDLEGRLLEKKQLFTAADQLCMPTFLQLGQDYQYGFDDWVYSYAIQPLPAQPFALNRVWRDGWDFSYLLQTLLGRPLWDMGTGSIWLMRAPRNQLFDRSAYRFFAGFDGEKPIWTADIERKQAVMELSENTLVSCTYVPWSNTYLFATEHSQPFGSNLKILQSRYPWGPWHSLQTWDAWGEQQGLQPSLFYWNFAPKWSDADGGGVIIYSGIKENDRYNSMRVQFQHGLDPQSK